MIYFFIVEQLHAQISTERIITEEADFIIFDVNKRIKFSNDERFVGFMYRRGLKVWDLNEKKPMFTFEKQYGYIVNFCFGPNNEHIIIYSNLTPSTSVWSRETPTYALNFINLISGKRDKVIKTSEKSFSASDELFISNDGKSILAVGDIKIDNYNTLLKISMMNINNGETKSFLLDCEPTKDVKITLDDSKIIIRDYQDNLIAYNISDGEKIWSIETRTCGLFSFSQNGKNIILGGINGEINIYDSIYGNLINTIKYDNFLVSPLNVSPDGQFAAVGSCCRESGHNADRPLALINMKTGKAFQYVPVYKVHEISFSENGKYLATISGKYNTPDEFNVYSFKYPPPYLEVTVSFDDSDTGGNGLLDNGEFASILLSIKNSGHGSAFGIIVHCLSSDSFVQVPKETKIGAIPADSSKTINIPILADNDAQKGFTNISIELTEANGNDAQPVEFKLPINRVEPPLLSISDDIIINDIPKKKPLAGKPKVKLELEKLVSINGNGNGITENDETVEAIFEIKNQGLGSAYGVKLIASTLHPDIKIHRAEVNVGDIAPNGKTKSALAFSTPRYFQHSSIDFSLKVVDNRASISEVRKDIKIDFKQRYPSLIFNYKIYDGTSDDSRGNSNGLLDQGEIIEFEISLTNNGNFKAKNISVDLRSDKEGIVLQKGNLLFGDIDPNSSSNLGSFLFTIQRRTKPGLLSLEFVLHQLDFEDEENVLNIEILEEGIAKLILKQDKLEKGDFLWLQIGLTEAGKFFDIIPVPNNPDIIYAATEKKGVVKSTNGGLDWIQIIGDLINIPVRCLAIDNEHPSIIYAGTLNSGVFKTQNEGLKWNKQNKGIKTISSGQFPECLILKVHPSSLSLLYLITNYGIYMSTNSAKKWKLLQPSIEGNITSLTILENFVDELYLGLSLGKLIYTLDGGSNWSALFSSKDFSGVASSISSIAINPINRQSIMVGTSSGEVFHSPDGGKKWVKLNLGSISKGKISSIQFDSTNPSDIYVCSGKKVLKSNNNGNTWFDFNSAISKVGDFFAEIISIDKLGNLIAIGENGLFKLGIVENTQTFPDINFQFNSFKIKTQAYEILNKIIDQLSTNLKLTVLIEGHTDNIGSVDQNQILSEKRAESVANYLMSKGVELRRITYKGYGMNKPVASNENEKDRMKNRRVELVLVFSR